MIKNEIKNKPALRSFSEGGIKKKQRTGFSWGIKIFIINAAFVLLILGLVFYSTTIDTNLVTDNYYEKELKYQAHIDKIDRANSLTEKVVIDFDGSLVKLKFPALGEKSQIGGYITCYRPSDNKMDIKVPVSLTETFEQVIPTQNLEKGLWKIKADWYFGSTTYFNEKPIIID